MRLVENVVDDIVNLHVVSNVTGAVRNQHVAVGILDRRRMVGKGLLAEMESPSRNKSTLGNGRQIHILFILHIDAHLALAEVVAHVVEKENVVALLRVVEMDV